VRTRGSPPQWQSICDVSSECGQLIALSLKSDHGSDHIVRISADIVDRTVHVKNGLRREDPHASKCAQEANWKCAPLSEMSYSASGSLNLPSCDLPLQSRGSRGREVICAQFLSCYLLENVLRFAEAVGVGRIIKGHWKFAFKCSLKASRSFLLSLTGKREL
jgi:hypothetical protein